MVKVTPDSSKPDISIIIPTIDASIEFEWLDVLENADVEAELIVRDDGSASEARNRAIREATADKLVFLDDDSVPQPGYFDHVSELLDEYPAVTGRIIDTGAHFTRNLSSQYDQGDEGHFTNTVVGCNMAVRREIIDEVGLFDERLPYGHEETELIQRICDNFDVWYSPDLLVKHPFADSLGDYFEKQYRHGKEAIMYYAIRGEDIHRKMANYALIPSHYTKPTITGTLLRTAGQLVGIVGLLRGYVEYQLRNANRPKST